MRHPARHMFISVVTLLCLVTPNQGADASTAKDLQMEPLVVIGDDLRKPLVQLPPDLQGHLLAQEWDKALDVLEGLEAIEAGSPSSLAFLKAWALIQVGRAAEGGALVDVIEGAPVPVDYAHYVIGSLLWANGKEREAQVRFSQMDASSELWLRAQVAVADSLIAVDRNAEAKQRLGQLPLKGERSSVAASALLKLGLIHGGLETKDGRHFLKQLSIHHPNSAAAGHASARTLRKRQSWVTWQELSIRMEGLAQRGRWNTILEESASRVGGVPRSGVDGCRFHFVRGKALYRRNRLKDSMAALKGLGGACANLESDYGARAQYLVGYAAFRRGMLKTSAEAYGSIPSLYPKSRLADDGYTRAGIALLEAEDLAGAQRAWREAIAKYPNGDTTPESAWRLAWTSYLEGKTDEAIGAAERLAQVDLSLGGRFVSAARYWSARWRMYPDVENPRLRTENEQLRNEAVDGWKRVCEEMPHSFYAVLAYSRLREEAPKEADKLLAMRRPGSSEEKSEAPWFVRLSFLENENVRNGVALARIGLVREALSQWDEADLEGVEASEMAWMTELRWRSGDWLLAHDAMRQWLRSHPIGDLGQSEHQVLRVAYPDQYWREVKNASKPMKFEARMFHALVREESNFNKGIVSYAGARGLSQVMPRTATETAKWLGKSLKLKQLFEPQTNLEIGAKYLDVVYSQTGESPFLALASYNAGPGRALGWVERFSNAPIDEYVESIPIRQTRHYVKRVMESWQIYRWHFDNDAGFPDLSRFNHYAKIDPKGR